MPTPSPRRRLSLLALLVALVAAACTNSAHKALPSPSPSLSATPSLAVPTTATASPSTPPASAVPPSASPPAGLAPATIAWRGCPFAGAFQCATINVPLDWSQPGGSKIHLALTRLRASGASSQRIGSLLINPGGPGADAATLVQDAQSILPTEVLRRFDTVGFDPRGTGGSQPLVCENGAQMDAFIAADPDPTTPAEVAAFMAGNQQFVNSCVKAAGTAFLAHMDTLSTARDMDYVRASLGDSKLSYVGYSYGTYLGAQYANLFPSHVRALVLDGAVDPSLAALDFDQQQAVGFQSELNDFFAWCAQGCAFYNGGNDKAAFTALEARITATPLQVGARQVDKSIFINGVAYSLYAPSQWPDLASALAKAEAGDGAALLALSDAGVERDARGNYSPITSANIATNCLDNTYPKDLATYQAAAEAAGQVAPLVGASNAWSSAICSVWPVPSVIQHAPIHAVGAPPILVIGTTHDPATPYQMAVSLASQLSSGVLLTHDGEGHTSLGQPSECVDAVVSNYLINLALPPNKSTCGSTGTPTPPAGAGAVLYQP